MAKGKIELELSSYIKQRSELMKSLKVPKLSDAKATLGEELAKIVFEQCDESLKEEFGLKPPLKGATGALWISPSDLLEGKIALTPPYTRKCIQALTHEGILKIGAGVEKKFLYEAELNRENALTHQRKELLDSFQDIIMEEIKDVEARERAACQREIEKLMNEFEETLSKELTQLEDSLRKDYESIIESQEQTLQTKWEQKLNEAVDNTVKELTKEFLDEIQKQEELLANQFKFELSKTEVKKAYDMGMQKAKYEERMKHLRHILECKNIANLMCMLCVERRKCLSEKLVIENYYKNEIRKLNNCIGDKAEEVRNLTKSLERSKKETSLRETCILKIIKQFQKFINFVLRSAPTQAEFLLSIEKLMIFELSDNILKSDITTTAYCVPILKWKSPEKASAAVPDLEVKDGHNCTYVIPPPSPDPVLPAFTYKDKLYIREDFQSILSKLDESENFKDLWLNDETNVEMLIDLMRESVKRERGRETITENSENMDLNRSVDKGQTSSIKFDSLNKNMEPQTEKTSEDRYNSGSKAALCRLMQKKTLKRSIPSEHRVDYEKIGSFEKKANILGTRSSLDMMKEKCFVKQKENKLESAEKGENGENEFDVETDNLSGVSYEKEKEIYGARKLSYESVRIFPDKGEVSSIQKRVYKDPRDKPQKRTIALETKDSLILAKMSSMKYETTMANFSASTKDSIDLKHESNLGLKRGSSKLVNAKDSIEVAKESFSRTKGFGDCKVTKGFGDCKVTKQSKRTNALRGSLKNASGSLICCDKCTRMKQSSEVIDGILSRRNKEDTKRDSYIGRGAFRISHIEIINSRDHNKSQVAFNPHPSLIIDDQLKIAKLYKPDTSEIPKVKEKPTVKDSFLMKPRTVAVVGDKNAKEYLQTTKEFTDDRIKSFISLIKDHPNLIRLFTAGQR